MKQKILLPLLLVSAFAYAQQESMISQYMFNGLFVNPAAAGSNTYWNASLLYRNQWLGFEGTPVTEILSVDGRLKGKNAGLGFSICNDAIGISKRSDASFYYAYHLKTGAGHLAMGLRGGASIYSSRLTELIVWDSGDENFTSDAGGVIIPNAGTGVYYYMEEFYAGVSIPNLISHKRNTPISFDILNIPQYQRHYYITAGGKIKAGDNFFIKPSTLLKYVKGAPFEADLSLAGSYKDMADLGVSYRTKDGLVFFTQMSLTKQLRFGYSFDLPLTDMGRYSSGTHEIKLAYLFGEEAKKLSTPSFIGN